jgi:hypothetical protein
MHRDLVDVDHKEHETLYSRRWFGRITGTHPGHHMRTRVGAMRGKQLV